MAWRLLPEISLTVLSLGAPESSFSQVSIAARRSNGGLRPIAMGEAFYKLSCLYMLSVVRKDIPGALGPMQFALSPGGSESAVLILQAARFPLI